MSYRIIGDSCMDLTEAMAAKDAPFGTVPLKLQVDDTILLDDDSFDQHAFLELMAHSRKGACTERRRSGLS